MSLRCVGTFQEDVTAQCSLGILCKLGNRGRTHSSSPRVPQDNSEITLLMQRSFSHYQVTEFLTHWTMHPWEKALGKKNRILFCFYTAFHCYRLPTLRTKSCFLPFSSRMWPWFLSPMMHVWGQKKWHKKSLWSWVGRKENNYLQLGHPMDPTSTEAKCFTHSNRATQQTGNSEYKRTKQKSRRLELTNRWQQTSKQTDKRKTQSPTPENDKSV